MKLAYTGADTAALKEELVRYLAAHDPQALKVISRLKRMAEATGDDALLGYAYYRYAYYYYFIQNDPRLLHRYLPLAIRHLIKGDDPEFLASAYSLVAYEAQDYNCYDIAYAYYMLAVQASKHLTGVAISGLVETSAGHLMTELGYPREGRKQIRNAIKRLTPLTNMDFYHYNMILNYADIALCSFLLRDLEGIQRLLPVVKELFESADENEKRISRIYHILPAVYHALLSQNDHLIQQALLALCRVLRTPEEGDFNGVVFEVETMVQFMLAQKHVRAAKQLLDALGPLLGDGALHLSCGGCGLCVQCARVMDEPCRHPDRAMASLESYGVDVYTTARNAGLAYTNGPNTVTYFGLVLYGEREDG